MESKAVPILWPDGLSRNGERPTPTFQVIRDLPDQLTNRAIENAVHEFVGGLELVDDPAAFFNQTLKTIAQATFLRQGGEFWLAHEDGEVVAYAIAFIGADIDDKLTYRVVQAWVQPRFRRKPCIKQWWEQMRHRAKQLMAQHILIVSGRNPVVFARWLGHGAHLYATLIKEDLNAVH